HFHRVCYTAEQFRRFFGNPVVTPGNPAVMAF
ncbi:MAG: hypothetical protein QOH34_4468, partial [Mycobacterium sp.]|nr:hypothetical protein [Mycobacterium sp.]